MTKIRAVCRLCTVLVLCDLLPQLTSGNIACLLSSLYKIDPFVTFKRPNYCTKPLDSAALRVVVSTFFAVTYGLCKICYLDGTYGAVFENIIYIYLKNNINFFCFYLRIYCPAKSRLSFVLFIWKQQIKHTLDSVFKAILLFSHIKRTVLLLCGFVRMHSHRSSLNQ